MPDAKDFARRSFKIQILPMLRRVLKTILRVVLITLAVAIGWGGWYINRRGFTREWRQSVNAEFEKHGLSVSVSRLTLDPFHGLIARDVEIHSVRGRDVTVAVISQVVLDIDYSHLLHHKPFLNGVDLRNTKVTLPLDPTNPFSPRIMISNLNARVLFPDTEPKLFNLSKADANIYGIHVAIKGEVTHPEDFHFPGGAESGKPADMTWLANFLRSIAALKFERDNPQLEIEFNGDARDPRNIFVQATLHGEKIHSGNLMIEKIDAVASHQNGALNLQKFIAVTGDPRGGTLDASGRWDPATGETDLQLRSTLDIQKVSHAFNLAPQLDDFAFYDAPDIEISAQRAAQAAPGAPAPGLTVTGHVALQGFSFKQEHFDGFNANFSWARDRWFVRDIHLAHPTGVLDAKLMQLPGDFRADIESSLNLNFLRQVLSGKAADAFSRFDFIDPPHVKLSVRGPSADFDQCIATGHLQLGNASLRHSPMDRAECDLLIKDRAVTYQGFRIERAGGVATGSFTYDFAKHEIRLDKIKSTLLPIEVAPWLDNPDMPKFVAPYRFKGHPSLAINGVVQFAGGKNTNLEILVDAPDGMDYTFIRKNLSASSISGRLLFTDGHLQLSNINATIFDGRVQGGAEIPLDPGTPGYTANVQVKNVDFQKLTKLYFDYDDSHGQLNGVYTFAGRGDDPRAMKGTGQVTVTNGNVFAIPFLGPFTTIMNSLVPGLGYDVARKATADFRIAAGVIDVPAKTFLIQGHGFNMLGGGKIFFLDDNMDFDMRINAQGLMGVLANPVSKLFEYTSQGSLSKPVWHPKRL